MANKTILVCDVCGEPATQSVTLVVGRRRLHKDYCRTHLAELIKGARPPRRGRSLRAGAVATAKRAPAPRSRRRTRAGSAQGTTDVAAEVARLRTGGMTYRQVGAALLERGITPVRAKAWNPVVLGRMPKRQSST